MSKTSQQHHERPRALDPELAALQVLIPNLDITDIGAARAVENEIAVEMQSGTPHADVDVRDTVCFRPDGSEIGLRVYRPRRTSRSALPALLFMHGGSFVMGGLESEHVRCEEYAADAECVVISVDYRLAPEHRFPAALNDCCWSLEWLIQHADGLGCERTRLAVGGLSAGGGLAAGLAARQRDTGGPEIILQLLLFPALDASMTTDSVRSFVDTPILTSGGVAAMWSHYLGPGPHDTPVMPLGYASPAALDRLAGLPPTFLSTAEFDPLRDEALMFAQRLLHANISVELRHYARAYHSFDSFRATRLGSRARRDQVEALRAAFL
jgi:acetyl esterase/lipase